MSPIGFLKNILRLMADSPARLAAFVVIVLIQVGVYTSLPVIYKQVFDVAIPAEDLGYLGLLTMLLGAMYVLELATEWMDLRLISRLTADLMRNLRQRLFVQVQKVPFSVLQRRPAGDLLTRFTTDMTLVEQAAGKSIYEAIFHTSAMIVATVWMFVFEWRLALIILLSMPLSMIGPKLFSPRASHASTERKQEDSATLGALQESVIAQKLIRAYALQHAFLERFSIRLGALHTRSRDLHSASLLVGKSASAGVLLIQLIVLLSGAWLAISGYISGGTLVGFLALLSGMGNSARSLSSIAPQLVQAATGLERIQEVLDEPIEEESTRRVEELAGFDDAITFEDVTFGYTEGETVLDRLRFTIPAGQSVAFVGRSGSGKSTVLSLLTRFQEARDGTIRIDGRDLRAVSENTLRSQVATVFQEAFLFSATIRQNIHFGRLDASDEEIVAAARSAEIDEFIMSLPEAYDTVVGEGAMSLSGGQRQRIALARAILRNPSILVLDEVTSALDPGTEAAINSTLEQLGKDRTVVTVTHRLTSVVNYDQIFILDQGRLVEQGTHRELLNHKGIYHGLWQDFTLEMTQDAVVGEMSETDMETAATEMSTALPPTPESGATESEDLQRLRQAQEEIERLRAINHRWALLAGTDRLTQLPNKLSFLQALMPQEIQQAQHDGRSMGLMLISGDNMGLINERLGRDAGDATIVELARILQGVLKGEDQLGHLDGTHFAVSLGSANLDTTRARAEEISEHVAGHTFEAEQAGVDITLSIGIACLDASLVEDPRATT
ncbi:MAG: ATP-binding cassette domain-containing protein, partial [Gemmatimonadetes bacterium]|nr:ATP-binding cassette domain-containing protein [Gemmatimonadota bacterium]